MRTYLSHIPLLPLVVGVAAGIAFTYSVSSDFVIAALPVLLLAALGVAIKRWWITIASFGFAIGWFVTLMSLPVTVVDLPPRLTPVEGTVSSVKYTNSGRIITVVADRIKLDSACIDLPDIKVTISTDELRPPIKPGLRISFRGDYVEASRERDFDWPGPDPDYNRRRGISFHAFVRHDSVSLVNDAPVALKYRILNRFTSLRENIEHLIINSGLDEDAAQFTCALLTGDDSMISDSRREAFSAAGVAHILALSGAHVAVIAGLLALLLFPLDWIGRRRLRYVVTIMLLWGFALMTGMASSVVRAVVMASLLYIGLLLQRRTHPLNALCLAALLILVFDPMSLFSPGFQLSFVATSALIAFGMELNAYKWLNKGKLRWINQLVAATLVATLATTPLAAYHFHQIPLLFLAANIVIVPVLPIIISCGLLLVVGEAVGCPTDLPAFIINQVTSATETVVNFIASQDHGIISGVYFSAWWLVAAYLFIAILYLALRRKSFKIALASVAFAFVFIVSFNLVKPRYPSEELIIERSSALTSIIWKKGDSITIFNNHDDRTLASDSAAYLSRLRHYLSSRDISRIKFTNRTADLTDNGDVINAAGTKIMIADSNWRSLVFQPVDYLLVTRHFRSDIVTLALRANADTILLSGDIAKRRRQRFKRELEAASVPVLDLGETLFHRSVK